MATPAPNTRISPVCHQYLHQSVCTMPASSGIGEMGGDQRRGAGSRDSRECSPHSDDKERRASTFETLFWRCSKLLRRRVSARLISMSSSDPTCTGGAGLSLITHAQLAPARLQTCCTIVLDRRRSTSASATYANLAAWYRVCSANPPSPPHAASRIGKSVGLHAARGSGTNSFSRAHSVEISSGAPKH